MQETIYEDLPEYIFRKDSTYNMLVVIKDRCVPTDDIREQQQIQCCRKLQKIKKGSDIGY